MKVNRAVLYFVIFQKLLIECGTKASCFSYKPMVYLVIFYSGLPVIFVIDHNEVMYKDLLSSKQIFLRVYLKDLNYVLSIFLYIYVNDVAVNVFINVQIIE
jgi:hypothetical protein